MPKILADENVHSDIIRVLREQGHEVLFVPEIGLTGSSDDAILQYSIKHNLLLLSGDKDFGGLIEFGTLWGKGQVILLRYRLINIKKIVKNICLMSQRGREYVPITSHCQDNEIILNFKGLNHFKTRRQLINKWNIPAWLEKEIKDRDRNCRAFLRACGQFLGSGMRLCI